MQSYSRVKSFASDRSGQFAIMFSLMLLPVLAGVGIGLDYTYALQTKTRLQDSVDATALYAATVYRKTGDLPNASKVGDFLNSDFAKSTGEVDPTVTRFELADGRVYIDAKIKAPTHIMQVFGNNYSEVGVGSVVNVGKNESIEVALVLDTTQSMAAYSGTSSTELDPDGNYFGSANPDVSRIDALKFSASQFTTSVFASDAGAGRVRIAVVPFSQYVNVGVENRNAPWLSVPADTASTGETCYNYTPVISSTNCRQELVAVDGANVPVTVCDYVYGPEERICYPSGGTAWYGCVGSRDEPLNIRDASPGTKFTGIMNVWCTMPLQTLSGDKSAVLSTINNLSPYSNTYIPEGVMWGLRTLSTTEPFTTVKVPSGINKVRKIMVLMTDGDNQAVADIPASPTHRGIDASEPDFAANKAKTDGFTIDACDEAKSKDVEIYTISFGTDISAASRTVVRNCATDSDHYFDARDAEALSQAFKSIAAQLQGFYLAG